jgi:hypothetical protein
VSMPIWSGPVDTYVNVGAPRQWNRPFFSSSYHPAGPLAFVWQKVDLKPYGVPADALTADVRGLLIITGATGNEEMADLGVIFRKPGDTAVLCHKDYYVGQTTFTSNFITDVRGNRPLGGGQRSNMQAHVPLENGEVEWCWTRSTWGPPQTEVYTLYGVSLSVQGFTRPRPQP